LHMLSLSLSPDCCSKVLRTTCCFVALLACLFVTPQLKLTWIFLLSVDSDRNNSTFGLESTILSRVSDLLLETSLGSIAAQATKKSMEANVSCCTSRYRQYARTRSGKGR